MIKYLKLSFLVVFFSGTLFAQQSAVYTHDLTEFNRAVELYKDKQFQAAQIMFDKIKNKTQNQEVEADCSYYIANCAIRLNQMGADVLVEEFVEDCPTSTKTNQAYIEIIEGIPDGVEVIKGSFKAINKELDNNVKVKVNNDKKLPKKDGE